MADFVEKIQGYTIGGNILDDNWVYKTYDAVATNLVGNNLTFSYSISDYLPTQQSTSPVTYEILGYVYITSTVTNDQPLYYIRDGVTNEFPCPISTGIDSASGTMVGGGAFRLIIKLQDGSNPYFELGIYNPRKLSSYIIVKLRYYRKLGTND